MPGVSARNCPLVVKVIGTDEKGRRIAAWAELNAEPATPQMTSDHRPNPFISTVTAIGGFL